MTTTMGTVLLRFFSWVLRPMQAFFLVVSSKICNAVTKGWGGRPCLFASLERLRECPSHIDRRTKSYSKAAGPQALSRTTSPDVRDLPAFENRGEHQSLP